MTISQPVGITERLAKIHFSYAGLGGGRELGNVFMERRVLMAERCPGIYEAKAENILPTGSKMFTVVKKEQESEIFLDSMATFLWLLSFWPNAAATNQLPGCAYIKDGIDLLLASPCYEGTLHLSSL